MPRHYSKVIVELPDSPSDPPEAVVTIDCDMCGEQEIRIHIQHLGTLLRVLNHTLGALGDDGTTESLSGMKADDPGVKQKVRAHMDRIFPEWKGARIRR